MPRDLIILIDGNALLHRAFHALPPLTTSRGELVNATYGFALTLFKALNELRPKYAAVAFDLPAPTFRHKEFEPYKAHRPKAAEGLYEQLDRVKELVRTLNMPTFEVEGFEADDVLGTLARQASDAGLEVVIVTGDTDALQLVGERVKVLTPRRNFSDTVLYDNEMVREKYGLEPTQLADFKGLKGDPTDNIPGVPGIGEKSASALLRRFGSIEGIYAHIEEIEPKFRKLLEGHESDALRGKRLATIVVNVPVKLELEACKVGTYDRGRVTELLRELEFKSLVSRLPVPPEGDGADGVTTVGTAAETSEARSTVAMQMPMFEDVAPNSFEASARPLTGVVSGAPRIEERESLQGKYEVVDTAEGLARLARDLARSGAFAVDVETTHKDSMKARLVGISVCWEPGVAYYLPLGHNPTLEESSRGEIRQLTLEQVANALGAVLSDESIAKYAHNGKYDITVLSRHGIPVRGLAFDTMIGSYLVDPSQRTLNLKDVAWQKLAVDMTPITALIGKGKAQITMADVPIGAAAAYACADVDMTYRLRSVVESELKKAELWKLFEEVEMPLVPVLAQMEQNGVALDVSFLDQLSRELHQRIGEVENEIHRAAGHRFNINSTQQLGAVLFEQLRLPTSRRTKTGYSTEADILEELRGTHPIVELVLEYRQLVKLKSTYVDALPLMINSTTGRLHTSFNQTGTVTGRLSSSEPNLQNIPIRTELGRKVRRAFVAGSHNNLLLSADYSQVELRILAHISRDPRLLEAFAAGEDIHAATASEIFGVAPNRVTPDMRRIAKVVNFGIIYGISDYGLSQGAGLSRREAAEYISKYTSRYVGVANYIEATKKMAEEQGYVTTILGRRRYLPEINVSHRATRAAAERTAINMPIQGTAADAIKIAMIRLHRAMQARGLKGKMILQVHDELVFEVPEDEVDELRNLVVEIMENALPLVVPLKVDTKVGRDWNRMVHSVSELHNARAS